MRVSSAQGRFFGYMLDTLVALFALGFGWFVWAFFLAAAGTGQTQGRQLLGMRCVEAHTGKILGLGAMTGREILGKGVLGIITYVTSGLTVPLYGWLLRDPRTQQRWDKFVNGVVVDLH